jgi:hypothetical protein
MANENLITVCVVALTQGDYLELDPNIKDQLTALRPSFDFATAGRPYAASPDEWRPFEVDVPIRQYLKKANLVATFVSTQLYDDQASFDVLRDTQLYIIDPFVLTHRIKRQWLSREVQRTIYTANSDKAFCIIIPSDLPPSLRNQIALLCSTQLNKLYGIRDQKDLYEWQVENAERLRSYLNRLSRQLTSQTNFDVVLQARAILTQLGVRNPGLSSTPGLLPNESN